jgi:hypothetical protein
VNLTQYYYLVASLPLLYYDTPPPFDSLVFLEACRNQLSEVDYALLARISFHSLTSTPQDDPVWKQYAAWETALRNELVILRASRLGIPPAPYLHSAPYFSNLSTLAKEALGAETPKSVDGFLTRKRWKYLDDLQTGTNFSLGFLIAYRLKLLLLERKFGFKTDQGQENFTQQYQQILNSASNWTQNLNRTFDTEK